jgi:carbamoyltransferase
VLYLGISQDRYDAGVALTDGARVLYAANEERFTRKKTQGGFPYRSLESALRVTGAAPADIGQICVAGVLTPVLPLRLLPRLQDVVFKEDRTGQNPTTDRLVDYLVFHTSLVHQVPHSTLGALTQPLLRPIVRRTLAKALRRVPLGFVEHHRAHAAAAWSVSGFDEALCITADGMGDGVSMTVNRCAGGEMTRLWSASSRHSLGVFYEMVTQALGFVPNRHEGKVTGLAAHGDWRRVDVPSPFRLQDDALTYSGALGRRGVAWIRQELCARYRREDVASWAQRILEQTVTAIARTWLRRTGLRTLVVGGGCFANVKLNQRLHELDEVREIFVCPNMGDGGLSLGAIAAHGGLEAGRVADVFWGDSFSPQAVVAALEARSLRYEACDDVERRIAELLAQGFVVARFTQRMEWGPRALGARSVLARADALTTVERLNAQLRRSEFMPFAPAVLDDDADECFTRLDGARHAAEFMTLCFDATAQMRRQHPGVVHVDGTVRPQLVRQATNPAFHRLLTRYKELTGSGVILNTSFNIHEEPIVRTPEEGITAFLDARLDYLALGDCLVTATHVRKAHPRLSLQRPAIGAYRASGGE